MVLSDEGLLRANSSRRTPVSAVRLDAVSDVASSPVATSKEDTLGMPYVLRVIEILAQVLPNSATQIAGCGWSVPYFEECKDN